MTLSLRYAARSHTGLIREGNEDSAYAGPRVLAVADGMGGHAAGEVASAVAIAALAPLDEDDPSADLLDLLRSSAVVANDRLRDMVAGDQGLEGMGTTLTALLFAGTRLGLLHIGDSRAYLLRDGTLSQITHDDTLVQKLVDEGRISEQEAGTHPQRSLITRALDGRDGVDFDLSVRESRAGDRYLLCTDGLTGPVGRLETLQEALTIPDAGESCERLVQLALRGGGPDNITVIVADVVDAGAGAGTPVIAGAAAAHPTRGQPVDQTSAAARARTAEGRDVVPTPAVAVDAPAAARSNPRRTAVVSTLVLVLVASLLGAGWAFLRSQYYVGVDQEQVAIYRGVSGTLAGLSLSSVEVRSGLEMQRLDPLALSRVERGIVAEDLADAVRIVAQLRQDFPPVDCPSPTPGPAPSASPTPAPVPSAGVTPTPSASPLAGSSASSSTSPQVDSSASPKPSLATAGCPDATS